MGKPLEEHLAQYILDRAKAGWPRAALKSHVAECMALWRRVYGERIAERTEKLIRERWKK